MKAVLFDSYSTLVSWEGVERKVDELMTSNGLDIDAEVFLGLLALEAAHLRHVQHLGPTQAALAVPLAAILLGIRASFVVFVNAPSRVERTLQSVQALVNGDRRRVSQVTPGSGDVEPV